MKVKILGAGSIGNHLAQASRRMGWDVTVVDPDPTALERMKSDLYPKRYGAWDPVIELFTTGTEPRGGFDIIMIGTPPDVRMKLALAALEENPRLLHLEKPLCTPFLEGVDEFVAARQSHSDAIVTIGYDHAVSEGIEAVGDLIRQGIIGNIITLDVEFREHWKGIFSAHPWLAGPWETYLGYWKRGGGAGGEHSHALHLWQHFALLIGAGNIQDTASFLDFKEDHGAEYDRIAAFLVKTERGFIGRVVQDVVTFPVRKWLLVLGEKGFIEWHCNGSPEGDLVRYKVEGQDPVEKVFPKKRPDDFWRETVHYEKLLSGAMQEQDSPLSFERGLNVMRILNKAYRQNGRLS